LRNISGVLDTIKQMGYVRRIEENKGSLSAEPNSPVIVESG